jgi:hypothetical protein
MSHRAHPAEGDKPNTILFDYCEDCFIKTEALGLRLDDTNWRKMWRRMLVTEIEAYRMFWPRELPGYCSRNEKTLGNSLYHLYVLLERRDMQSVIDDLARI